MRMPRGLARLDRTANPKFPSPSFFAICPALALSSFVFYLSLSSGGRGAVGLKKEPIQHRKRNVRGQLIANATAAAYFLKHRQVNDPEVLAEIATQYGFTREEALGDVNDPRELEVSHELAVAAAQQGIQGVPFFIFDNRFALSGAQPEEVFDMAFKKALEEAA